MKVVFCLNNFGSYTYNLFLAKTAIISVKKYTSLQPVVFYNGENTNFINFMKKHGVEHIETVDIIGESLKYQHSSSDFWKKDFNKIINFASGAFLRFEVANYLKDDYCMYADVDVLFTDSFSIPEKMPEYMAMSSQDPNEDKGFNSGVILFNLNNFRNLYKDILKHAMADHSWIENGYDQFMVNKYFKDKIETLDMSYNWRPFFGIHPDPKIIHYELVKPFQVHAGENEHLRSTENYKYYEKYYFDEMSSFFKF